MANPVVQVINEKDSEIIYTIRINGTTCRPKVFAEGTYTIKVGELGEKEKVLKGVKSMPESEKKTLSVEL